VNEKTYPAGKLPHAALTHLLASYTHGKAPDLVVPPSLGEDAAVIDFGGRYLVVKTDPITFATDAIGAYAVHVNANDIAAMGATPRFFLSTLLLPAHAATPTIVEAIFRSIYEAAASLDIAVCGGHTEITPGIDRPIVIGQMLGEVAPDQLVRSSGLRSGDDLVLTKGMGIEATALIAREKRADLLARGYTAAFLDRCAAFLGDPGISAVLDAKTATGAGRVTAMHDPTEGGVATALYELAAAADVGIEIDADALLLREETRQLCAEYELNPLGIISSGAMLIGCAPASTTHILAALAQAGIAAARIGRVRERDFGVRIGSQGETRALDRFETDELTHLFAS
jgi:hydrogenase expression/formation protein HypE